ncbi:hypothetical protein BX616_009612, partial [Lobosporangium transversale]
MTTEITLFCIVDGDSTAFSVDILPNKTVDHLKKKIKEEQSPLFDNLRAQDLILFHVLIPSAPKRQIALNNLTADDEANKKPQELDDSTSEISEVFGSTPAKKTIH